MLGQTIGSRDMNMSEKRETCKSNQEKRKRRKCLYHPAMECPTPNDPCIFGRRGFEKKLAK
jgi:hypothetical protein